MFAACTWVLGTAIIPPGFMLLIASRARGSYIKSETTAGNSRRLQRLSFIQMAARVQQYLSKNHGPPTEHAPPTEHTDGTTCSLDTPQLCVRFENVNSEPFAMDALHPEMHPHDLVASIPSWNIQPFHDIPGHAIYSATLFPRLRQEGQRPIKVCLKWARCEADVDELKAEAEVYRTALCHLQGTVVPIYYGCFIGKRPGFAATYGCLILEWCATDSIPDYGCKT